MPALNLLSDPTLAAARAQVEDRLHRWADGLDAPGFADLLDPLMRQTLSGAFRWVGADEGTVWLADEPDRSLVAVFNTGPDAERLIGFRQPLNKGIVSLVYANEQAYCENEIANREKHDSTLDKKLGNRTGAMVAVPFYFAYGLRGVISCVQFAPAGEAVAAATGFDSRHVREVAGAATLVERLIDGRLLAAALGMDHA
jgi:hypothetical protein